MINQTSFQKSLWIVGVLSLLTGFAAVVLAISTLQGGKVPADLFAAMGLTPGPANWSRLSWCETRITELEAPQAFKLYQEGIKWKVQSSSEHQINSLDVEKWFGENCTVDVEKAVVKAGEGVTALVVQFVEGSSVSLKQTGPEEFLWKGQAFRSPQLDQALKKLKALALGEMASTER